MKSIFRKAYEWLVGDGYEFSNGSFQRLYLSPTTYSGKVVTPESATQSITVLRCVTLIAGAAASLPIDVITKGRNGQRKDQPHKLEYTLDSTPNPENDSMEVRVMLWLSFLLWGNAYARIVWDGDRVVAIWPLHPSCVEVKRREADSEIVYLFRSAANKPPLLIPRAEILHIRWFPMPGSLVGMSPIERARQMIGRAQTIEEYSTRFFASGAAQRLAFQYPEKLSDAAIKRIQDSFQAQYGSIENAWKLAVLEQGATVSAIGVKPKDAQFLEQEQYTDEKTAMLYGLPPHMVGLVSKSTSWGTGLAEQVLGWVKFGLNPLLVFHEKAYERCLLRETERRVEIKHNLNAFLRGDIKTRFEAYAIGIQNAILSPNRALELEDMEPYEGGDSHYIQGATVPVELAGKHLEQPKPAEEAPVQ